MPFEPRLRQQIALIARHLYERGHNAPGDGNISARLSCRYILCTPTQAHKGRLGSSDIVKVRLADLSGVDGKPSSEIRLHRAIYEVRPDVSAIVHGHSPFAVALTVAGHSLEWPVVPEAIQAMGSIPTVPYQSPTTEEVAEAVVPYARSYHAFILERHGTVALGGTLEQALSRLEVVEHTARITQAALAAGGAPPIDEREMTKLMSLAIEAGVLPSPTQATGTQATGIEGVRPTDLEELADVAVQRVLARMQRKTN